MPYSRQEKWDGAWASESIGHFNARFDALPDVFISQVETLERVDSRTVPVFFAMAMISPMSTSYGGRRLMMRPVGWNRMSTFGLDDRTYDAFCLLLSRQIEIGVHRDAHDIELHKDVIRQIQCAVLQDVTFRSP